MKYCIKTLGMYIRAAYAKENVRPEDASFGTLKGPKWNFRI
jgi:hypothetical protein